MENTTLVQPTIESTGFGGKGDIAPGPLWGFLSAPCPDHATGGGGVEGGGCVPHPPPEPARGSIPWHLKFKSK